MHNEPGTSKPSLAWPLSMGLAVVAGFIRLIPHPFNMTPVGALGLFGGARLRLWQALTLPLTVMAVTDLLIWLIQGWRPFNSVVYGCFLVNILLGRLLSRTSSPLRIAACSLVGSVLFFMATNFAVWVASSIDPLTLPAGTAYVEEVRGSPYAYPVIHYARNLEGLAACYWLALAFFSPEAPPFGFFGNLVVGDLFFCGALFGAHAWLGRRLVRPTLSSALASRQ